MERDTLLADVEATLRHETDVLGSGPVVVRHGTEAPGILGSQSVKWNFTKFLVGRDGKVVKRYAPTDTPDSMRRDIEAALAA